MRKIYTILFLVISTSISTIAQVSITAFGNEVTESFDGLANAGTTNEVTTLPSGWTFLESGTNANTTYAAGTGSSNTGNTYSFGTDTDRALGGLLSGSLTPTIGASFLNQTGGRITSLIISYRGEQWRLGATGRGADRLDFEYSINASSLNSGTWIAVNELDFNSPVTSGTVGLLNGNTNGNFSSLSYEITGLDIPNGATFYIRWLDFNVSSSDDGLAVDDFSLTASGEPGDAESITFTPSSLAIGEVNLGQSRTVQYQAEGENLTGEITVNSNHATVQLSIDGVSFTNSIQLPDIGGVVVVRFTPEANGPVATTLTHTSGSFVKELAVTGSGFDQVSNIIPIAEARSKAVGARVTVAGRITVAHELGNPAYVQDATGGIPVFFAPLASGTTIGDSVIVTGPIGVFNDQIQISGNGIFYTPVAAPPRIVAPKVITANQMAANEGLLVTLHDVELVNDDFVFYPQSTDQITDATGTTDLRIDGDTDIAGLAKPHDAFSVTGVVGRFRTNWQLLPRASYDIPSALDPTTPSDTISKSATLDVVTWNFEFFGATSEQYGEEYGPADEALQLANIKRVLDSLNADVVAVQEVSDETLFASLAAQAGYGYTCSQRYSYSFQGPDNSFPPQKVCFLYDTTVINIRSTRVLFETRYDSARTIDPALFPGYPGGSSSSFFSSGRLPYLLEADVTIRGVKENIAFVVLHAKSGAAADDRQRRLYDGSVLKDSLDQHFGNRKFIVLGDLNDDLDQSITVGQSSPYQNYVTDVSRYNTVSKALSDAGARSTVSFGDVIDHQIISNELTDNYIDGSVQLVAPFRWITNYASTTSDHLPVITRYQFTPPTASFGIASLSIHEGGDSVHLSILLSEAATTSLTLPISVAGSATLHDDFLLTPAVAGNTVHLQINEGDTLVRLTIAIVDDMLDEVDEDVILTIGKTDGINVGATGTLSIQLTDNDVPVVAFSELTAFAREGSGQYHIKFALSTPPATDQTVTVRLFTLPYVDYGSDYETTPAPSSNTLEVTIPEGATEGGFYIDPKSDTRTEKLPEVITFYLQSASDGLVAGHPRLSFFTILDVKKHGKFSVHPNPTRGPITISNDDEEFDEEVYAELVTESGNKIFGKNGKLHRLNRDLSDKLSSQRKGVYYLNVIVEGEKIQFRIVRN